MYIASTYYGVVLLHYVMYITSTYYGVVLLHYVMYIFKSLPMICNGMEKSNIIKSQNEHLRNTQVCC